MRRFCKVRPVEVKAAGGSLALCVQGYDLFFARRHRLRLDPCCPVLVATQAVHCELPHTPSLRRQTRPRNPAVQPTGVVLAVACVRSLAHLEASSSLRVDQELSGVKEPPELNHGRSLLHVFHLSKLNLESRRADSNRPPAHYEFAPLGSTKGEIFGFPRLRALMTPTAIKSARRRW